MLKIVWRLECSGCKQIIEGNKYEATEKRMLRHKKECEKRQPWYYFWKSDYAVFMNGKDITSEFNKALDELRAANLIFFEDELSDVCNEMMY